MPRIGILIPFKYNESTNPEDAMDPREADIDENIRHAERFGAVYWDLNILTNMKNRLFLPTCCYFYDARPNSRTYKKVTHKAEIVEIYTLQELKQLLNENPDEWKCIPEWRYQCIEGQWTNKNSWVAKEHPKWIGSDHESSIVWIKLTNFEELNPPLEINAFRKWDGKKLKGVRGAYIKCLE